MTKYLNEKVDWAIRDDVRELVQELVELGFDRDLALGVIEQLLPENQIYNLPDQDNDE